MIEKRSWSEFRKAGLLWLVNSMLQIFGWSIVFELSDESGAFNDDAEPAAVYPARVKHRGFSVKNNGEGYKKITEHLHENIEELLKEIKN